MANFQSEESAFNFAVEYLKGISESLKMCKSACAESNPYEWYKWLRIVFREASVKLTDDEKSSEIDDFNNDFKAIVELLNSPNRMNKNKAMTLLDNLEIKLRRKIQERGMLLPSKSDPKFAILQR